MSFRARVAATKRNPLMRIMDEICDWLRANGITPGDVPLGEVPKIKDGAVTVDVYLRPRRLVGDGPDAPVARKTISVPLVVAPPASIAPEDRPQPEPDLVVRQVAGGARCGRGEEGRGEGSQAGGRRG